MFPHTAISTSKHLQMFIISSSDVNLDISLNLYKCTFLIYKMEFNNSTYYYYLNSIYKLYIKPLLQSLENGKSSVSGSKERH